MNKQIKILLWMYEYYQETELPKSSGEIYQDYEKDKEYTGSQPAFSKLIGKLKDKGLLKSPAYGKYDLSERGERKAKFQLGEIENEVPKDRPEGYGEVIERLEEFVLGEKESEIRSQLVQNKRISLSLEDLDKFDPLIVDYFEENPDSFIDALEEGFSMFEVDITKVDFDIRPDAEFLEVAIGDAKTSKTLGHVCIVEGIIKRTESVKQDLVSAIFECSQCGDRYEKEQDSSQLKSPYKCDCGSRKFETIEKKLEDCIEIVLSNRDEKENTIKAELRGDIDKGVQKDLMTGKRVKILGKAKERSLGKKTTKHETVLEAISYENLGRKERIESFDDEKKREVKKKMLDSDNPFEDFALSLAPHLGDMVLPKKCIAASLIGSPRVETENEIDYGRIHTAVIANPGLGKSGLQGWTNEHIRNSFLATGERGSGSGLTASVEQVEGGRWELVAGKVVFADKGILGVDEFDKFPEGELVKLNSAMERGKISVDLATTSADLNARATIIASGNFKHPPDEFEDPREVLPEKGQGLYDRFALMCGVTEQDTDKVHDSMACRYVKENDKDSLDEIDEGAVFEGEDVLIFRKLAKDVDPVLTTDSYVELKNFVDAGSEKNDFNEDGSSNRFLKHLIKITLCVARCNLREEASKEDALEAIKLMRECRESLGFGMGDGTYDVWDKMTEKKIRELIEDLKDNKGHADVQDICDEAKVSDSKAEKVIKNLMNDGEAFEPEPGKVKLM